LPCIFSHSFQERDTSASFFESLVDTVGGLFEERHIARKIRRSIKAAIAAQRKAPALQIVKASLDRAEGSKQSPSRWYAVDEVEFDFDREGLASHDPFFLAARPVWASCRTGLLRRCRYPHGHHRVATMKHPVLSQSQPVGVTVRPGLQVQRAEPWIMPPAAPVKAET
jgi:hypothetical protein